VSRRRRREQPNNIPLRPEDIPVLRSIRMAIEQHETTLMALRQTLARTLTEHYRVDVMKDSWLLDLDRGVLERVPEVPQGAKLLA